MDGAPRTVVSELDLELRPGIVTALVGESGSGKSTAAVSLLGLPPEGARIVAGRSMLEDTDLLALPLRERRALWGRRLAYLPQGAGTSLNPVRSAGSQIDEALRRTSGHAPPAGRRADLLERVGLDESYSRRFPGEISGGQQQRVALALALAGAPDVLVLDEPTSGLDVTTELAISSLIAELVHSSDVAALFVTHNFGLVQRLAAETYVMYAGQVVEVAPTTRLLTVPGHPYTQALLDAVPALEGVRGVVGMPGLPPEGVVTDACAFAPRCRYVLPECTRGAVALRPLDATRRRRCVLPDEPQDHRPGVHRASPQVNDNAVLDVEDLYCAHRPDVHAVAGISLVVRAGETLAIVGESGSGKSTLLKAIAGLMVPESGTIRLDGQVLAARAKNRPRETLRQVQLVFQDPYASLNPRRSVGDAVARPLRLFRRDLDRRGRAARTAELLERVQLPARVADRFPDELSGGQRQRVALARAFAAEPHLLLCDEVVSALDVSVQASIFELLVDLVHDEHATVLFVTHDIGAARVVADRIAVLREGRLVEIGMTDALLGQPRASYTRDLIAAVPRLVR